MDNVIAIHKALHNSMWFRYSGAYTLFDGQFGSTGKGLLASVIAMAFKDSINIVTTNAGPNSGHTAYFNGKEVMTQQIPVASVFLKKMGVDHVCYLNAGAVVDKDILLTEIEKYGVPVIVDPHAALITDAAKEQKLSHIASTGKGVGPAMAHKLMRDRSAVVESVADEIRSHCVVGSMLLADKIRMGSTVFVETAQGFSLGINSGFYPYSTSRECTVGQAIADARIPPQHQVKSIVSLRTYPIRVGNTPDGHSGGWYSDQEETTWEEIGQKPELTTVTKRVRRVASFSMEQYKQCLIVNRPDAVFMNFCNYMKDDDLAYLLNDIVEEYRHIMGRYMDALLLGFGPNVQDVRLAKIDRHGTVSW
jgi:adenylosuccinate synthase